MASWQQKLSLAVHSFIEEIALSSNNLYRQQFACKLLSSIDVTRELVGLWMLVQINKLLWYVVSHPHCWEMICKFFQRSHTECVCTPAIRSYCATKFMHRVSPLSFSGPLSLWPSFHGIQRPVQEKCPPKFNANQVCTVRLWNPIKALIFVQECELLANKQTKQENVNNFLTTMIE